MKIISNIFSVILLLVLFSGCGKDNFDAPESKLVGRVTYQGQALNLRGTGEAVQLQLYQDGYEKNDPISVFVGQDGTFSALLFDGEYRLTTRDGNGPFMINRIVPDAKISRVMLLLSKTQFADDVNNLYRQDFSDVVPGSVNLSADISGNTEIVKAKALYARVGVLANGADQAIYSPVVRLK